MMKFVPLLILCTLPLLAPAAAAQQDGHGERRAQIIQRIFERLDRDRDGRLTLDEFKAAMSHRREHSRAERRSDDKRDEMRRRIRSLMERREASRRLENDRRATPPRDDRRQVMRERVREMMERRSALRRDIDRSERRPADPAPRRSRRPADAPHEKRPTPREI